MMSEVSQALAKIGNLAVDRDYSWNMIAWMTFGYSSRTEKTGAFLFTAAGDANTVFNRQYLASAIASAQGRCTYSMITSFDSASSSFVISMNDYPESLSCSAQFDLYSLGYNSQYDGNSFSIVMDTRSIATAIAVNTNILNINTLAQLVDLSGTVYVESFSPSSAPTSVPSPAPSAAPSHPTAKPTSAPSIPTSKPTSSPTHPTSLPTQKPTSPTSLPTSCPTVFPTQLFYLNSNLEADAGVPESAAVPIDHAETTETASLQSSSPRRKFNNIGSVPSHVHSVAHKRRRTQTTLAQIKQYHGRRVSVSSTNGTIISGTFMAYYDSNYAGEYAEHRAHIVNIQRHLTEPFYLIFFIVTQAWLRYTGAQFVDDIYMSSRVFLFFVDELMIF